MRLRSGLSFARGSIGGSSGGGDSGGGDGPVALVLAHALGFSKECWAPVLEELAPLLRRRVEWVTLDFSGHGASTSSPPTGRWDEYHVAEAREVLQSELRDVAPASRTVGVGHSMGGAVLAALELRQPGSLARVAAIEPPIFPAAVGPLARLLTSVGLNPLANAAAQRRHAWPSAAAVSTCLRRRAATLKRTSSYPRTGSIFTAMRSSCRTSRARARSTLPSARGSQTFPKFL